MLLRGNLLLSNKTIKNLDRFIESVNYLINTGFDNITCWQIRDNNDQLDKNLALDKNVLNKICSYFEESLFKERVKIYNEKDRSLYEKGHKLTLFPDGRLTNSWCN